jgi:hypothetical protein
MNETSVDVSFIDGERNQIKTKKPYLTASTNGLLL